MSEQAKLRWRCRRGMKELDVLLLRYLEQCYDSASKEEQRIFADLLELQDPQLFGYIIGRETPTDAAIDNVIEKLRAFHHC
jgi:antitoxin CptB